MPVTRQDEFEQVAMVHSRSLLRVASRLTLDRSAAEDLVQETLLGAWRGFHRFQTGTNARAWLFRILFNNFYAQARKAKRAADSSADASQLAANGFRVQTDRLEALAVAAALDQLAAEHRAVLLLGVVEGFTCQEMSEILSIPLGTIMSRLSRARRALRERLEGEPKVCARSAK